jgi:hypothetical protein
MARSFMIHAALHWGDNGLGDIELWSFAVDHAAWLYNQIPQMVSQCKSDHCDLIRTDIGVVWCMFLSLHCRMERSSLRGIDVLEWVSQILGLSSEHSSMVVLMWNLHTGYVSPLYHVLCLMTSSRLCSMMESLLLI